MEPKILQWIIFGSAGLVVVVMIFSYVLRRQARAYIEKASSEKPKIGDPMNEIISGQSEEPPSIGTSQAHPPQHL